jgi:hypothetical protein
MKIRAYIEAPPVGADFISSWAGKPGNQVALVAEGTADLAGLERVAQALHNRMGVVGWFSLDAWLECDGRIVGYCQLGYMSYPEVLRLLGVTEAVAGGAHG